MVNACGKGEQPKLAMEVFEALQLQGVLPDIVTYNASISACEKGKELEQALDVFEALRLQGMLPEGFAGRSPAGRRNPCRTSWVSYGLLVVSLEGRASLALGLRPSVHARRFAVAGSPWVAAEDGSPNAGSRCGRLQCSH